MLFFRSPNKFFFLVFRTLSFALPTFLNDSARFLLSPFLKSSGRALRTKENPPFSPVGLTAHFSSSAPLSSQNKSSVPKSFLCLASDPEVAQPERCPLFFFHLGESFLCTCRLYLLFLLSFSRKIFLFEVPFSIPVRGDCPFGLFFSDLRFFFWGCDFFFPWLVHFTGLFFFAGESLLPRPQEPPLYSLVQSPSQSRAFTLISSRILLFPLLTIFRLRYDRVWDLARRVYFFPSSAWA